MALKSHIEELERQHGALESFLKDLMQHPSADNLEITEVKRMKLHLKDRIVEMETALGRQETAQAA